MKLTFHESLYRVNAVNVEMAELLEWTFILQPEQACMSQPKDIDLPEQLGY